MSEVSTTKVLKKAWFFIACFIFAMYDAYNGKMLESIQTMVSYFFIEIGILIALAKAGALKISGKIDVDDK